MTESMIDFLDLRSAAISLYLRIIIRLWHQLTQKVLEFLKEPESGPLQIPLFQKFVVDWENKINKLSLVYIGLTTAQKFSGMTRHQEHLKSKSCYSTLCSIELQDSVNFLSDIITKVDTSETKDAYVYAVMETTYFKLLMGQTEETKKAIDECEKILDQFDSVETAIYSSFYRVSADYFKAEADYAQYYKSALLFLACINIDEQLTKKEREERAFDLAIAALLGDSIYNFGELVSIRSDEQFASQYTAEVGY
jgi:26S proteasome regulatory subunit N9